MLKQQYTFDNSSVIQRMEQYGNDGLIVTFKDGDRYVYTHVPEDVVRTVANSDSVGRAFNALIRPKYNVIAKQFSLDRV